MNTIKFRIAAKTDKGLVRSNNEDNFQASSDLTFPQMRWINNEICSLGDKGALLVVADGMGGMNAGEVASELAIETVKEWFAPENLTSTVMSTRYTIERYMNDAIVAADAEIKKVGKERPETRGMGTTIVIGWLLGGKLYVSWCGDSRAYVYNPEVGLHQITKDHSYVQSLVDKGKISHEDAFDYPDSNIITRSLSDGGGKAKPESLLKPYEVCDNDVILLCTDGLCGMIRDCEIEAVIRANEHNVDICADELIRAACDAEGSDNITVCLCQILQGGRALHTDYFVESDARLMGPMVKRQMTEMNKGNDEDKEVVSDKYKKAFYALLAFVLLAVLIVGGYLLFAKDGEAETVSEEPPTENVPKGSDTEKSDVQSTESGQAPDASAADVVPNSDDRDVSSRLKETDEDSESGKEKIVAPQEDPLGGLKTLVNGVEPKDSTKEDVLTKVPDNKRDVSKSDSTKITE